MSVEVQAFERVAPITEETPDLIINEDNTVALQRNNALDEKYGEPFSEYADTEPETIEIVELINTPDLYRLEGGDGVTFLDKELTDEYLRQFRIALGVKHRIRNLSNFDILMNPENMYPARFMRDNTEWEIVVAPRIPPEHVE